METDAAELIIKSIQDIRTLGVTLSVLLAANIGIAIIKYIFDNKLKDADVRVNKASLINSRKVAVQEDLFHKLDTLSRVDETDSNLIITETQEAFKYINKYQLFIPKELKRIAHEILDYFTTVGMNSSNKNIGTETTLLEKYTNEFLK